MSYKEKTPKVREGYSQRAKGGTRAHCPYPPNFLLGVMTWLSRESRWILRSTFLFYLEYSEESEKAFIHILRAHDDFTRL